MTLHQILIDGTINLSEIHIKNLSTMMIMCTLKEVQLTLLMKKKKRSYSHISQFRMRNKTVIIRF